MQSDARVRYVGCEFMSKNFCVLGFVPSTDLMRNASGMQKFLTRYIMHGMLRFTKMTRSIAQGAQAIIALATDDKYKGKCYSAESCCRVL